MSNDFASSIQPTSNNPGANHSSFPDQQTSAIAPAHKAIAGGAAKLFRKGGAALHKALCCPLTSKPSRELNSIKKVSLEGFPRVSEIQTEMERVRADGTTALKAKSSQFHLLHFRPSHPSELYSGQLNSPVPLLAGNIIVDVQETKPYCLGNAVYSCALQANYKKISEVSREKFVPFIYENVGVRARTVADFLTHSLGCPVELVENNRGFPNHSDHIIALLDEGPVMASFLGHPKKPWTAAQFSVGEVEQSRPIGHAIAIVGFSSHEKSFVVIDSNHTKPGLLHRNILDVHISYPLISFKREHTQSEA